MSTSRQVFTLPDLGEGLADAQLVRWLVAVGDTVAVDAPVAEVETAKAVVEVPCPYAGVVACLHGEEGDVIGVGAPLVSVDPQPSGSEVRSPDRPSDTTADVPGPPGPGASEERGGSGNVLVGYGTSAAPVVGGGRRGARRAAAASPVGVGSAAVPARAAAPPVSSPLVRAIARRSGLALGDVAGTGPGGMITRADVERASHAPTGALPDQERRAGPPDLDARTGLPVGGRVPLRGVRKTIAATMTRSRQEIPEATTWVDVDATDLLALRTSLASTDGRGAGLLALLARFVVTGLGRFPELNARVDLEGREIVHLDGVNLGIATQTDRGLVVPVVRAAHLLGTRDLDAEIRRLTTAARDGEATTAELTGGSFTLNSYGSLGVDGSAAIINHPEVAILGIGRILPRAWVVDGAVAVRSVAQLSLVFDHRVCDGGTAGGFLRFVADAVESPVRALVDAGEL